MSTNKVSNDTHQEVTFLSDAAWGKLMQTCQNPPEPTAAMRELMAEPPIQCGGDI